MRRHEAVHCLAWDSSLLAAVKACHFALRRKWQVLVHGATGGGNNSSPFCLHVRMLLMMPNAHKSEVMLHVCCKIVQCQTLEAQPKSGLLDPKCWISSGSREIC